MIHGSSKKRIGYIYNYNSLAEAVGSRVTGPSRPASSRGEERQVDQHREQADFDAI